MPHRYMVTAGLGTVQAFLVAGSQGLVVTNLKAFATGTTAVDYFIDRITAVVGGTLNPILSLDDPAPAPLATFPYLPTSYTTIGSLGQFPFDVPVQGIDLVASGPIEVAAGNGLRFQSSGGNGALLINVYFEE